MSALQNRTGLGEQQVSPCVDRCAGKVNLGSGTFDQKFPIRKSGEGNCGALPRRSIEVYLVHCSAAWVRR